MASKKITRCWSIKNLKYNEMNYSKNAKDDEGIIKAHMSTTKITKIKRNHRKKIENTHKMWAVVILWCQK